MNLFKIIANILTKEVFPGLTRKFQKVQLLKVRKDWSTVRRTRVALTAEEARVRTNTELILRNKGIESYYDCDGYLVLIPKKKLVSDNRLTDHGRYKVWQVTMPKDKDVLKLVSTYNCIVWELRQSARTLCKLRSSRRIILHPEKSWTLFAGYVMFAICGLVLVAILVSQALT